MIQYEIDMGFYKDLEKMLSEKSHVEFEPKGGSLCLKGSGGKDGDYNTILKCIKDTFELDDSFDEYFKQATSGNGNEAIKINTIWSSSLLSLLVFSNLIKKGIIIPGVDNVVFKKCFFEYKNLVTIRHKESHPSNIDVVLMDEEEKHIVFIESKFIEYKRDYRSKKLYESDWLKTDYDDKYTDKLYKWFNEHAKKDPLEPHYYYGLKQMITHFSGLCNFMDRKYNSSNKNDEIYQANEKDIKPTIYLVEIVYDLTSIGCGDRFKGYKDIQDDLREAMKKQNTNINVLEMIRYQDLIKMNSGKLDKKIADYYQL